MEMAEPDSKSTSWIMVILHISMYFSRWKHVRKVTWCARDFLPTSLPAPGSLMTEAACCGLGTGLLGVHPRLFWWLPWLPFHKQPSSGFCVALTTLSIKVCCFQPGSAQATSSWCNLSWEPGSCEEWGKGHSWELCCHANIIQKTLPIGVWLLGLWGWSVLKPDSPAPPVSLSHPTAFLIPSLLCWWYFHLC